MRTESQNGSDMNGYVPQFSSPGASSRNREAGLLFYTGFFGSLDLTTPRESFRGPTLPRFHKGNSGGELAVAGWQLTEASSGRFCVAFWGGSTGEGAFSRSPQKGHRDMVYISIYQPPPPTTNTAPHPPTAIRPWVRLPFRSKPAGRSVILSRRVITAMPRPASASTAALVARRPIGRP